VVPYVHINNNSPHYRLKILQNIGAVFVRMGQYSDAMTSYEHIMSEKSSVKAGELYTIAHVFQQYLLFMYVCIHNLTSDYSNLTVSCFILLCEPIVLAVRLVL